MLRLAIFLGVVLVLFHAGTRDVTSSPETAFARIVTLTPEKTNVRGPYLAAGAGPEVSLPNWEPAPDPAPFDLSTTTGVDPRMLAAVASDGSEPNNIWHVDVMRLPLRAGPSLVYPELGALTLGQTVISDGNGDGDWIWVRTEDSSLSGYVASHLVSR